MIDTEIKNSIENKDPILAFQLSEPLKERLREEAFKRRLSISALIREILEKHFEER